MKLQKINKEIKALQNFIVSNNDKEGFYGDGKSIAESPDVPIKHSFADQIYVRQMNMKADQVIVGAIHNHQHVWFLLTGHVSINNNGEVIDYVAPCYTVSEPGSKRVIYAHEDSIFVNVHKNPLNVKDIKQLEEEIVSISVDEFNKKNK
jgi:quercetin dioxygenase-like cupin family protein